MTRSQLIDRLFLAANNGNVKKVGIMGAHSTGKTTLAADYADLVALYYPRTTLIFEQARACPYPINQAMTLKSKRWLFGRQIVSEASAAMESEAMVCDRTILDPLVYATWLLEHGHGEIAPFLNLAMPYALKHLRTYTVLFWCRPVGSGCGPVDDGFRDTDPDFQYEIDRIFERFVSGYGITVEECAPMADQLLIRRAAELEA